MKTSIVARPWFFALAFVLLLCQSGCTLFPQRLDRPEVHNPFPQLRKIAVVPFFNQSDFPRINGAEVASAYRHQLQQIRGFEVLPIGVVDNYLSKRPIPIDQAPDFQQMARDLGVDAVVVGSITDFDAYYPPRMGLAVRWYAANSGFHPIPPGYGLPWGTAEEEYIPEDLRFDAEFALAAEQLKTQTPMPPSTDRSSEGSMASVAQPFPNKIGSGLPTDWPDANGFVPDPPSAVRPIIQPHRGPVMELIKQYDGSDSQFTARLASYYEFRDDARFGGWQSYLERSDDFIKFCCYLHISELLTARGGAGHSRPTWRWPLATYQP
ncbi:MAG: hypothetical protein Q8M16_14675 [Pirellulaceae bacterium]|nr:hypothetical protein [Pirellulaceae bacterium]